MATQAVSREATGNGPIIPLRRQPVNQRKDKLIFSAILFIEFISNCSTTLTVSFFYEEATEKGMQLSISGILIAHYAFVEICASSIFGKILPRVGVKVLLVSGLLVAGSSILLFGTLKFLAENSYAFIIFCFLTRTFEAVGRSAYSTASVAFAAEVFPMRVGLFLGYLEASISLGLCLGPVIGGSLYSVGGFGLPFYTLGGLMVLSAPGMCCCLPSTQVTQAGHHSFRKLLKIPSVIMIASIVAVTSSSLSFLHITLEPHFLCLDLTWQCKSIIWMVSAFLFGASSPLWGLLADKKVAYWTPMMIAGLFFTTIGFIVVGPPPVLDNKTIFILDNVGLYLIAVSLALVQIPTYQAIMMSAVNNNFPRDLTTYGLASGTWHLVFSLGEMIGPISGGILSETFGFHLTTNAGAILPGTICVVAVIFFWYSPIREQAQGVVTDATPLLSPKVVAKYSAHASVACSSSTDS